VTGVVDVLSFPFRVLPGGSIAGVEQDTPDHYAELLTALVMTRIGERDLCPGFGTPDPLFTGGIEAAAVASGAALFGPPVRITGIETRVTGPATQNVTVSFD
jgi:hypothetical protein